MFPAIMAAGFVIQGMSNYEAALNRSDAAEQNSYFYREQAKYAERVGQRQRDVFDREAYIAFGETQSAFAKAGVDSSNSAMFLASEIVSMQQESAAIKMEADQNVRLAMLRAEQSDREASDYRRAAPMGLISAGFGAASAAGG